MANVRRHVEKAVAQSSLPRHHRAVEVLAVQVTPERSIRITWAAPGRTGTYESGRVADYFDGQVTEEAVAAAIVRNFAESFAGEGWVRTDVVLLGTAAAGLLLSDLMSLVV